MIEKLRRELVLKAKPKEELPLEVIWGAYEDLSEQIKEKQLLQLELYQEIEQRLMLGGLPLEETVE